MSTPADPERLISHQHALQPIAELIQQKGAQIRERGDLPQVTVTRQLDILQQLGEFDFGRFLLQHRGINGYWTHYMLTYPWRKERDAVNPIQQFLLERAPTILATQQRFQIFLAENQLSAQNGRQLACIPSGMMGELLYLDFTGIDQIGLVGIDYDQDALMHARTLAAEQNLLQFSSFIQADAWHLQIQRRFDLISSNGLNIYEPDDDNVLALYRQFHAALKPGGRLVTSFLTPPPGMAEQCEWNMSAIDSDAALLQKIIFADVLGVKWQCFRSTQQTRMQLEHAGFGDIRFIPDRANLFPTVTAVAV